MRQWYSVDRISPGRSGRGGRGKGHGSNPGSDWEREDADAGGADRKGTNIPEKSVSRRWQSRTEARWATMGAEGKSVRDQNPTGRIKGDETRTCGGAGKP